MRVHGGRVKNGAATPTVDPGVGSGDAERDEAALIRLAQAQPAAFGALYQRYVAGVYRYLRARTGTAEDAADLTQQVFLQALEALPTYRERGLPFGAWLFRIARNAATNFARRQRRGVSWDRLPESLQPHTRHDPETYVLQGEALAQLHRLLETLDPEKRELLALRFAAKLTAREIAAVVGKGEAAVKKQLARIVQFLQEQHHDV